MRESGFDEFRRARVHRGDKREERQAQAAERRPDDRQMAELGKTEQQGNQGEHAEREHAGQPVNHHNGHGIHFRADALRRIALASQTIGIAAVLVHAKDEAARRFYLHAAEFIAYPDGSRTLFLPIETVIAGAVVLTPQGEVKTLLGDELDISYRHSALADVVVLGIYAHLTPRDPAESRARMKENVAFRKSKQAWGDRSAGCVFKNPSPEQPAGKLIDAAGLKGLRCGGALVSEKHANFIVNKGGATAADVEALIVLIKRKVRESTGVLLEEEVIRIP